MSNPSESRTLDNDYVCKLIGNRGVKSFTVSKGANKGDNVIGKMLCIEIETEDDEKLTVVVKSLIPMTGVVDPATIGQSMFYVQLRVFDAETCYYEQVRPVLSGFGYLDELPRYYSGVCDGVNSYIVLEDLRVKGFQMADKFVGMDLKQVVAVMHKLARLHGSSFVAIQNGTPKLVDLLEHSCLNGHVWGRKIQGMDQEVFFNTLVLKMSEVMGIHHKDQSLKQRMKKYHEFGYKIVIDLFEKTGKDDKYFRVINHGDLWTNNVLFKYKCGGEIEDITFIDYQQVRFGNVFEDLLYFMFTSTTAEFRKTHLRDCLIAYYTEFASIVEGLNGTVPCTQDSLINVFYENLEYAFAYELIGIPFQLGADDIQDAGADVLSAQQEEALEPAQMDILTIMCESMKRGVLKSPIAIQRLTELCDEMIKLNVI